MSLTGKFAHLLSLPLLAGTLAAAAPGAAVAQPAALPSWADQLKAMEPLGDRILAKTGRGATEAERQDMYRWLMTGLSQRVLTAAIADPRQPTFVPLWNASINFNAPNPDYMYSMAEIDGRGVYRVSGYRGTALFVNFTLKKLASIGGGIAPNPSLGSYDLDDLHFRPDGYFSVLMSAERPAGYTGHWWKLEPAAQAIMVRRASYHWGKEVDARLAIERVDGPVSTPPQPPEDIAARIARLPAEMEGQIEFGLQEVARQRKAGWINRLGTSDYVASGYGALLGQTYYEGLFDIADDEALIVEGDVPKGACRYWSILVSDLLWRTVDWVNRQSALNGAQARVDGDGKFRAVIAARDPGVPNWLDTAGNREGNIQVRYNRCDGSTLPRVTKVKLAAVRQALPRDTPVVTPAQRDQQLRQRRESAQLRILW